MRNGIEYFKMITMTILLFMVRSVTSEMEGMIVGGEYAKIRDFPHVAFLAIQCVTAVESENYSCGSSILNQRMLLTAAHCFEECLPESNIAVGVAVEKKRSSLTHLVAVFTLHPKFDAKKVINDVALAKLTYDLVFSSKVKRVALVKHPPYHEEAAVAGWGLVEEGKRTGTMYLKSARQKIWKRKDCIKVLTKLNKGTICARGIKTSHNYGYPAAGDSGSALILRGYIQVGLVSVKYPQLSKSVIVFTHIPYFYKWIKKTSKKLYCMKSK